MNILFTREAWADYLELQRRDPEVVDRLHRLLAEIRRTRFSGVGKPEPLRQNLTGWWSRRLTAEHRIIYRIVGTGEAQRLEVMACRFHYRRN
jgi:toxin YoeB